MENNNDVQNGQAAAVVDEETPESEEGSDKDLFEVKDIVDVRMREDRSLEYRVCWDGYPNPDDDTWEPDANIMGEGARAVLESFRQKNKQKLRSIRGTHRGGKINDNDAPRKKHICADDISTEDSNLDRKLLSRDLISDDERKAHNNKPANKTAPKHSLFKPTRRVPGTPRERSDNALGRARSRNEHSSVHTLKCLKRKTERVASSGSEPADDKNQVAICPSESVQRVKIRDKGLPHSSLPGDPRRLAAGIDIVKELGMMRVQSPIRGCETDDDELGGYPVMEDIDWDLEMKRSYNMPMDDEYNFMVDAGYSVESFMTVLRRGISEEFSAMIKRMDHEEFLRNVRFVGEDGKNCLHMLATTACDEFHGVDDILALILKRTGRELLVQADSRRRTPLHYAISSGYMCHVKTLINQLAPLDVCDRFNETPLQAAYRIDSPAILRTILSAGGNFSQLFDERHLSSRDMQEVLAIHKTAVTALLKIYRGHVFQGDVVEVGVASSIFTSPMHDGPLFVINTARTCGEMQYGQRMLLVISVCCFHGPQKTWTGRCWGGLPMADAPQINGKDMKPAFEGGASPMVFECPMIAGNNVISLHIQENPELYGLILAAQVVIADHRNNNYQKSFIF